MTRIRIVGGKIIETTGGDYNIYTKENIVYSAATTITETGVETGVNYGNPEKAPIVNTNIDFDIKFELDKSSKEVVPFGIANFKNEVENPFFKFNYKLTGASIDSLSFEILDSNGNAIYSMTYLKEIVVQAENKNKLQKEFDTKSNNKEFKVYDFKEILLKYVLEEPDYTKIGNYSIFWDGFDSNKVYNSTLFNGKKLKAKILATKGSQRKQVEIEFETKYNEVDWVDVKIDKKSKRIDATLRVNLKDGGANGIDCYEKDYDPDPKIRQMGTVCPWDNIPTSVIKPSNPVLKTRTKTFEELKKIVFKGLEHYWGRNKSRSVGNHINIVDSYEVYINAIDTDKNALNSLPLVYVTNGKWMRSGNPGGSYSDNNLDDDILNALPDLGIIQRLSYNTGYIKHDWDNDKNNGWRYYTDTDNGGYYDAISEFKETASHEIGHEILQAYSSTVYSWQHKGSSYYLPQDTKPVKGNETIWGKIIHLDEMPETSGEYYPKSPNEIDLMKYYNSKDEKGNFVAGPDSSRLIASEKDVLGLIWLTKIEIQ